MSQNGFEIPTFAKSTKSYEQSDTPYPARSAHDILTIIQTVLISVTIPFVIYWTSTYAPYLNDKDIIERRLSVLESAAFDNEELMREIRDRLIVIETKIQQ